MAFKRKFVDKKMPFWHTGYSGNLIRSAVEGNPSPAEMRQRFNSVVNHYWTINKNSPQGKPVSIPKNVAYRPWVSVALQNILRKARKLGGEQLESKWRNALSKATPMVNQPETQPLTSRIQRRILPKDILRGRTYERARRQVLAKFGRAQKNKKVA